MFSSLISPISSSCWTKGSSWIEQMMRVLSRYVGFQQRTGAVPEEGCINRYDVAVVSNFLVEEDKIARFNVQQCEAVVISERVVELMPDRLEMCKENSYALINAGRYQEALVSAEQALKTSVDCPELWFRYGDALANLGRYREALVSFDRSTELAPDLYAAWTYRGVVLIHLQRYEEALVSCERALEIQPDDQEACLFRGVALQRLGRYRDAYQSYGTAFGTNYQPFWKRLAARFLVRS